MENIIQAQQPILISEKEGLYNTMLTNGRKLFPLIRKVKEAYLNMKMGEFSNEVFTGLISGGTASAEERLITDVTERYEALNLRSETMKNEILADAYRLVEELKRAVAALRTQANVSSMGEPRLPLSFISINGEGEPEIKEEAKERIREDYCRVYLRTPEEVSLHAKLQAVAGTCSDLLRELQGNRYPLPTVLGSSPVFEVLKSALQAKDGEFSVNPDFVGWAVQAHKRKL
ncbi:hypothetical protein EFA69_09565 [Rufibacter immobilis]|uniref:Uncharacterized protein n=1 Tax=Rufibacter immobilis TaxID=1348778 RepID=A0A3M9MW70_9BACT|nr:hypothetical protein [Rufibacter immobilis]RNI29776.1 hypothetical protein EFA69_09565 [Rufibacter immobilis]